jgi:hypothetical protein
MAITVSTQDLENYPGISKNVTVDQTSVVPQGNEGDEEYVMSFSTSAYSDNATTTSIQTEYVTDFLSGWARSSGFAGSANKFTLTSGINTIGIKMDSTVSGTGGTGYYDIVLDYNTNGTPVSGDAVAADMEEKIRALADNLATADSGFRLAYLNASVEYKQGAFWIISGSMGSHYTGSYKTSVAVQAGSSNDASAALGFNITTTSEDLESMAILEALVTSGYTVSGTTMTISQNIGASSGDCLMITDRTNTDYFQLTADPTGGTILTFDGDVIQNSYTANEAKVQLLREQDPLGTPVLWYDSVDAITRFGLKTIINQIDYSS